MPTELELDALPSPGEPLEYAIDENNQKVLDSDIAERIQRQQSRLSRWQKRKLTRRLNKLHKQLNKARYNQLVVKRFELWQRYTSLKHQLKSKPSKKLIEEYQTIRQLGNETNQQIASIQHIADEFDDVNNKLKAHQELLDWEREDNENLRAFQREARTWEQQLNAGFAQIQQVHHKGTDSEGVDYIDIPIIEQIIIKDDRVLYLIKTTGQTLLERFFGRWHSALPYGVKVADLISEETLENLKVSCNRVVTVERSKRGSNLFYVISRLDAPDGIPNKLLYQKAIDWYPVDYHSKTPWCAGVTNDRQTEWFNFEDTPHMLIAGATQGGKSNHVNQMIATLTTMNTPQELRVLLVDLKGGIEFTHWKGLQHQLKPMLTTPDAVLEGLQWLHSIMERRLDAFEIIKAKDLNSYNAKAKDKLPRIVCFVDEMATLIGLGDLTKDLHTELRVLSAQGRAVGIHLVLCTQHSSVDVLPGWVKTNMGLRVSAKMPSHQASMVILDSVTASTLPDIPGRMVFSLGRSEIIAQSPFISDEQIEQAIKLANSFSKPDNTEFISVLPKPEPAKPEFKRTNILEMCLNEFNGHLSARKVHIAVGNEVMARRQIEAIVNEVVHEWERGETIAIAGNENPFNKEPKAYYLEPIPQSIAHESDKTLEAS